MAEQSSTVVAFRGLVMLVCLILIPVAAFCGGSFPAVVKAIQSGRWPTFADFRGPTGPASGQATEAPRFVPRQQLRGNRPQVLGFSSPVAGFGPTPQGETAGSAVIAANYNAPISPPRIETGLSAGFPQDKDSVVGPRSAAFSASGGGRRSSSPGSAVADGPY